MHAGMFGIDFDGLAVSLGCALRITLAQRILVYTVAVFRGTLGKRTKNSWMGAENRKGQKWIQLESRDWC